MLILSQALRQLLIDGDNLIDLVNRQYRLDIKFEVGLSTRERAKEMAELGLPAIDLLHFIGTFPPLESRVNLNRRDFLKFEVINYKGEHFSVQDIIKTSANRLGGVHIGDPETDDYKESKIRELGKLLDEIGLNNIFSVLILISNITYNALLELQNVIQKA